MLKRYLTEFECPSPDYIDGEVVVVDEWKSGMNILVEFNSIPEQLTSGWSLKIQFDPPLGVVSCLLKNKIKYFRCFCLEC